MMKGFITHAMPVALVALALLVSGCAGSGEGDTTSTEVSIEGSWSGTYAPAGATHSMPVYAMIQKDGTAFFYDDAGIVYRMPRLNGGYTFSGAVKAIAPIGYEFKTSAPDDTYNIRGAAADSEITGELRNDAGTGQLDLSPVDTYRKEPGIAGGQWMGYYISPTPYFVGLVVDDKGAISGDDVFGCHLSGRISQHRVGENLFDVTITTVGPKPICGIRFTGLAHEADYDTYGFFKHQPGTYYYMGLMSGSKAFAAEFKVQ